MLAGATGGEGTGGSAAGGDAATGGAVTGGNASGGDAAGGNSGAVTGGSASGGEAATGGAVTGGSAAGGDAAGGNGGAVTGGSAAGGEAATGGSATGGSAGAAGRLGAEPGVRFVGRTAPGTGGTRFGWPGVSIQARFVGTQVTVQLDDGGNENEFTVVLDGVVQDNLVTVAGTTDYQIASGLANGTHELVLWRRTEGYFNPTEFLEFTDFGAGGELLAPPPAPARRLEIVGDSITAGYGNEGAPGCTGTKPENNYLAYGSVAARALGADLHTVAWSGIGVYRNYGEVGPSADAMPARYDLSIPTEMGSTWDFSQYRPHGVIINLGTNDYSTQGDPGQPFIDAYLELARHIRSQYPDAFLFCLIQWTGNPSSAPAIQQVVDTLHSEGDMDVEAFDINVAEGGSGCDGHPDLAKHQAMGEKLANEIARVLGW